MQYLIETYGCQMNKAESSALELLFRERAWEQAAPGADPDLVLINTCSVRITAETRAWGRIDHWAGEKTRRRLAGLPRLALVVTGCMAERLKKGLRERQPAVDQVIGTFQKQAFGLVIDSVAQGRRLDVIEETPSFVFADSYHEPSAFRSFLPIMHGCDNFCTYCIVPHIRGREVSRDPAGILAELDGLEAHGVREVTLLGQNVNSYRWKGGEGDLDFAGLLRSIADRLRPRGEGRAEAADRGRTADGEGRGIRWLRFLTSHPKDLTEAAIEVLASEPLFCRNLHLPVQAGSDAVLRAMNRKYTRADYLSLVEGLRKALPGLALTTDLLVGFPGETEEDFEETLDLMRRVRWTQAFMYHFNPREGTPAASMAAKVPDKVKKARLAKVIELQQSITAEELTSRVGAVEEVLVEDLSRKRKTEVLARTARDEMVVFPGDSRLLGSFVKVRLLSLSGNTFKAEEL